MLSRKNHFHSTPKQHNDEIRAGNQYDSYLREIDKDAGRIGKQLRKFKGEMTKEQLAKYKKADRLLSKTPNINIKTRREMQGTEDEPVHVSETKETHLNFIPLYILSSGKKYFAFQFIISNFVLLFLPHITMPFFIL